ncbi:MAG: protease complex subunit PrcB family protein [Deltaproteobacteria bacterium]|nr:protease complex subunit PrcB family protein [Deltaproteobacteria bacterium]
MAMLAVGVGACSVSDYGQNRPLQVAFATVDEGFSSGMRERRFVVIKAQKEWESLWREHKSAGSPRKEVPAVDFKQEMLIGVFSGEKRTGGYRIEITKIEEDSSKNQLSVHFSETAPPPDSMAVQMLTQPYHIVKLKRVDSPVVFVPVSGSPRG